MVVAISMLGAYTAYRAYVIASVNAVEPHKYVSDEIYYVDTARRYLEYIFHIPVNESMYSGQTNKDYFNLEHPPVGKYLIALSMIVCGDKPLCWRLPGIIESGFIPVLLGLAFLRFPWRRNSGVEYVAALAAAAAASADPILYYSGSVAMLDIHLAFFESLSLALFMMNYRRASLIVAGLAIATKFSGAAIILAFLLYDVFIGSGVRERLKLISEDILIPFIIYVIVMIPLAYYFGVGRLVTETINALKWHTTSRPPGPPTSTPLGWIFNSNPFFYSFYPIAMPAILNSVLHFIALVVLAPLAAIGIWRDSKRVAGGPLLYAGVILTYVIVWILGNHTFYSFYSVQLTPGMAAIMGGVIVSVRLPRSGD